MILRESGPRSHWRRPLVFEPRITVRGTNGNRRGTDRRRVVRSTGIWTLAAYTHWGIESYPAEIESPTCIALNTLCPPSFSLFHDRVSLSLSLLRASLLVLLTANDRGDEDIWCTRAKEWSVDRRLYTRRERSSGDRREKRNRWRVSLREGRTWIWVIGADANAVRRNSVSSVYFRGTGWR